MKRQDRIYNVLFPIWLFWLWPSPVWLLILPANFAIDSLVLILALKWRRIGEKLEVWKRSILKIWVIGSLSDLAGAALILGLSLLTDRLGMGFNYILFPGATLISLPGVILAGALIYFLNRRFSFKRCAVEPGLVHALSLALAVFTAPYAMLIPLYG